MNHEEVAKAMEEGVRFAEGLSPIAVDVDDLGHAQAIRFTREDGDKKDEVVLPARAVIIAAGTQPNTVLAREDATHVKVDGRYFAAVNERGEPVKPERSISKPNAAHVLMSIDDQGRAMSYFGDLHPSYFGNVVKAMGSAKQGHPVVSRVLAQQPPRSAAPAEAFFAGLEIGRAHV